MVKFGEVYCKFGSRIFFKTFHTQTAWVWDVFETFADSSRCHSKNNSPQRSISTLFSDQPIPISLYSQRVQKPLQETLSALFCTKLQLNLRVWLVWRHKIISFLTKTLFAQFKGWSQDYRNPQLEWSLYQAPLYFMVHAVLSWCAFIDKKQVNNM